LEFDLITRIGNKTVTHQAEMRTVLVEPDVPRLIMVWQSGIDCNDQEQAIRDTTLTYATGQSTLHFPEDETAGTPVFNESSN
jgi:hypothetical protein